MNLRNCFALVNSLENAKNTLHDAHFKVRDISGNELILYVFGKQIYIPNCEDNFEIEVLKDENTYDSKLKAKMCFRDIPIKFSKNGKNETGFLTNTKIITKSSTRIKCGHDGNQFEPLYIEVENATRAIMRLAQSETQTTTVVKNSLIRVKLHTINTDIQKLNFEHYTNLASRLDNLYLLKSTLINNEKFYSSEPKEVGGEFLSATITNYIQKIEQNWKIIQIILMTASILTFLILTIVIKKYCCCCCRKTKEKQYKKITKNVNLLEAFLPEPSERNVNSFVRRSNSIGSLDPATTHILNNLRSRAAFYN